MTEDVIALLDHLEWTAKRELHIVGISLGGMIAQELATRIPERIVSILLGVTTPGGWPWNNLPPWNGFSALATLALTQDPAKKVPIIMDMIFPIAWLNSKAEDDPAGRTNRQIQSEVCTNLRLPQ
ncbi:hypothetical protein H0H81_001351 [Sphagnurus paluster]|uniref:AB hydrolase-1 domain-containing protein n=1 Tax=Sphagnurus paluster TaxID=117069 RepID=A0A9P7GUD5_9AGAR|nr:hypothetical protein H0H81_001351 [Sphagnurus paluster]